MSYLVQEIKELNMVFRDHKVGAMLLPVNPKSGKRLLISAPGHFIVPIARQRTTKISQVSALLPELQAALYSIRRSDGALRFSDPLATSLEIGKRNPKPLVMPSNALETLSPFQAVVGKSYAAGIKREILTLTDPAHASILVGGITGAGKSNLNQVIIGTLAASTSPQDLHMYLIDLKGKAFKPFERLPHVRAYTYDATEASKIVRLVHAEIDRRKKEDVGYRVFLAIDELRELALEDKDAMDMLSRIASLGRELGVHLLGATQKPLAEDIGSVLKSQFTIRLAGVVDDANASRLVTGRNDLDAHLLRGAGSMLMVVSGRGVSRVQVPLANPADYVERAIERWGSRSVAPVDLKAVSVEVAQPKPGRVSEDAQRISHLFEEYFNGETFANGAKTKFAAAIGQTYAGGGARRVNKAIEYLMNRRPNETNN